MLAFRKGGGGKVTMGRELLIENLMTVLPEMHKKMFKGLPTSEISFQQGMLLLFVSKNNGMTMSYYSDKTMISKPNLTLLAEKLIEEGFLERGFDKDDRRIITLHITQTGLELLDIQKRKVQEAMMQRLSSIEDSKIDKLNELFDELKKAFL